MFSYVNKFNKSVNLKFHFMETLPTLQPLKPVFKNKCFDPFFLPLNYQLSKNVLLRLTLFYREHIHIFITLLEARVA